jgi:hypothetical protein
MCPVQSVTDVPVHSLLAALRVGVAGRNEVVTKLDRARPNWWREAGYRFIASERFNKLAHDVILLAT